MNLYLVNQEILKAIKLIDNGLVEDGRDVLVQMAKVLNRKELKESASKMVANILFPTYFDLAFFNPIVAISNALETGGFDVSEINTINLDYRAKRGRAHVKIGYDIYLTLTWYQMPSGSFEFVGYIS